MELPGAGVGHKRAKGEQKARTPFQFNETASANTLSIGPGTSSNAPAPGPRFVGEA
jgi:hypothetical protein